MTEQQYQAVKERAAQRAQERVNCPDCGKEVSLQGLGTHRRQAHGREASDPRAVASREQKRKIAAAKKPLQANKPPQANPLQCDQCDFIASSQQGLMIHKNRHSRPKGNFKCPDCDRAFIYEAALIGHRVRAHGKYKVKETHEIAKVKVNQDAEPQRTNGHIPPAQAAHDQDYRLEAAATFAAGRVSQLCESIALQQDLPAKSLTALVLRVVHTTTLR